MLAGGDPHLQPEGDAARGVGKDSFIQRDRVSLSCRRGGQSESRGREVLSGAAHSIARHKWQPKVELTENESRARKRTNYSPRARSALHIFEFSWKSCQNEETCCSLSAARV